MRPDLYETSLHCRPYRTTYSRRLTDGCRELEDAVYRHARRAVVDPRQSIRYLSALIDGARNPRRTGFTELVSLGARL